MTSGLVKEWSIHCISAGTADTGTRGLHARGLQPGRRIFSLVFVIRRCSPQALLLCSWEFLNPDNDGPVEWKN